MKTIRIPIRGMHCASCEILVGTELKKIPGVGTSRVSYSRGWAEITYSGERPSNALIEKAVQTAGYAIGERQRLPWISRNRQDYRDLLRAVFIVAVIYYLARAFGLFDLTIDDTENGSMVALLVGLVAGVSTCMALIGGLVLGFSARHAELHPEASAFQKFRPHVAFNTGRILGFAAFGGVIGLFGQALKPSVNVMAIMTIAVGFVMIFLGMKLVEIFPVLRDKTISLPSGIARFFGLQREVKEYSSKKAAMVGALTFFLPCGFTQAMQLYALSSGGFFSGMLIMGLFAVGTAPGLLGIGGLTAVFKGRAGRIFFMAAGIVVLALGLYNISNARVLLGGNASMKPSTELIQPGANFQEVRMTQNAGGYAPNRLTIKKDQPVKWIITSTAPFSCASALVVPSQGISTSLKRGENIITFTPTRTGTIDFMCSMGMYRGQFIVIE